MSLSTSDAFPARIDTTFSPQCVTHNYESMVAQSGSQQINGPVYGDVHYGNSRTQDELIRDRILASLWFEGMDCYHDRPLESFRGTYEWIFAEDRIPGHICDDCATRPHHWIPSQCREMIESDERANQSAADFRNWLRHSDEIFWVSGKAGAGKSCLMKFLVDHPRTRELLCEGAGTDVKICAFFFWAAGGELERSTTGLLRSLLYQCLSHDHEAIRDVLTRQWVAMSNSAHYSPSWERSELREALVSMARRSRGSGKLCLFVDGLDEYSGDYQDLINDLDALNRSAAIKLCVSSRPWNVFRRRYVGRPAALLLELHELTYRDLSLYVAERLGSTGAESSSDYFDSTLRSEILSKAQGVFLWVNLVVNDLRRGLAEGDSLPELRERLEVTPSDVNKFIEKIFDGIEPVYKKYCAQTLLLLLKRFLLRPHHLPLSRLWCLVQDGNNFPSAWETTQQAMSSLDLACLLDESQMLANTWCKDLVLVTRTELSPGEALGIWEFGGCRENRVSFAHRAILDFAVDKRDDGTLSHLAGTEFSPAVFEILAVVKLTKLSCLPRRLKKYAYRDIIDYLVSIAPWDGEVSHMLEHYDSRATPVVARGLTEISRLLQHSYASSGGLGNWIEFASDAPGREWPHIALGHDPTACDILLLAKILERGLADVFWAILAQNAHLETKLARYLWIEAAYTLEARGCLPCWNHLPLIGTIERLLEPDVDLNELSMHSDGDSKSTWQCLLFHTHQCINLHDMDGFSDFTKGRFWHINYLLDIFLAKGADPGCHLFVKLSPCSAKLRHECYKLTWSEVSLPAIETFELALPFIDKCHHTSTEHKLILKEGVTGIIQKLRQALEATTKPTEVCTDVPPEQQPSFTKTMEESSGTPASSSKAVMKATHLL